MERNQITVEEATAPFRNLPWDLLDPMIESIEQREAKSRSDNMPHPDVFFLSGPAESGKSHVAKFLISCELNCNLVHVPSEGFRFLRSIGMEELQGYDYDSFKATEFGREKIIAINNGLRGRYGARIIDKMVVTSPAWMFNFFVILDNVGWQEDLDFYKGHTEEAAGVRILQRHGSSDLPSSPGVGPDGMWEGDIRGPIYDSILQPSASSNDTVWVLERMLGALRDYGNPGSLVDKALIEGKRGAWFRLLRKHYLPAFKLSEAE